MDTESKAYLVELLERQRVRVQIAIEKLNYKNKMQQEQYEHAKSHVKDRHLEGHPLVSTLPPRYYDDQPELAELRRIDDLIREFRGHAA